MYLRQTGTKDIQPRYEQLIREHVEGAKPFVLKNTVSAERREKVIETEVARGMNVLITNPELVRTGLDLLFAPTIIFVEVIYNLSTLMQAAARSYRLNQTHEHCAVKYLYYQDTMEQTAVHLMSRKQRAAKLLTGDSGLTGLDSLTQGEGSFEQALLDAIAQEDALVDPTALFTSDAKVTAIDEEDMAFWNVNIADETPDTITLESAHTVTLTGDEAIVQAKEEKTQPTLTTTLSDYLADHHIVADSAKYARLLAKLGSLITDGQQRDDETYEVVGMRDKDYLSQRENLIKHVARFLKKHSMVFMGQESAIAEELVKRCEQALNIEATPTNVVPFERAQKKRKRDLMAVPDDMPIPLRKASRRQDDNDELPRQLAMF